MTFSYFLDEFSPQLTGTGGSRRRQQWKKTLGKYIADDDDDEDDDDVDDVDDEDDDDDNDDDEEDEEKKDIYTKNLTTPTEVWGIKSYK